MAKAKRIEHKGIVKSVGKEKIAVSILAQSACSSCHAKSACSLADMQEKIIDINTSDTKYREGELVNLFYEESLGYKALFLAYIIPFFILLLTLIVSLQIFHEEGIAGLISLLILVPYYLILYFYKEKLRKTFTFKIEKKL